MAAIQLDRLLETCHRRGATDILLMRDSSPCIRLRDSWRPLQTPALIAEEVTALAREALGSGPHVKTDACTSADLQYEKGVKFRVLAFGFPETRLLLIARYPDDNAL